MASKIIRFQNFKNKFRKRFAEFDEIVSLEEIGIGASTIFCKDKHRYNADADNTHFNKNCQVSLKSL